MEIRILESNEEEARRLRTRFVASLLHAAVAAILGR